MHNCDNNHRGIPAQGLLLTIGALVCLNVTPLLARMRFGTTQSSAPASAVSAATQPVDGAANSLAWFTRFADALDASRRTRQPILVEVGAEWCVWCRELDKEIATDAVQEKLRSWTRLRLDADRDADAIHNLAVGPLPAIRVLTASGQVAASHDGFMKADELAAWLDVHAKQLGAVPSPELEATGTPDSVTLDRIVEELTDRDPLVHQAAARRLLPYPEQASAKVVAAFADGKLRQRLAAEELLAAWKAPVKGLDPWKPQTITPVSLELLKQWAGQKHEPPTTASLSGDDLGIARHDIATMLQTSDQAEVESARERLARFGPALLPEVYAALKLAATDRDRERLTALRYRAVATDALTLHWPGGFDRLASTDAKVRHQALDDLATHATPGESPLLMELFSDPDALVRETSLRLLQSVGGAGISGGLVRLLHDPDPNVRAAVLKQLAQTPDPHMVPEVVKYVSTEKDIDLVVHSIRFLREAKGKAAMECLQSLLGHESWRVRAEAAEGLGAMIETNSSSNSSAQETKADIYSQMIKLLDDPDGFVVSRALGVLKGAQVPSAIKAIAKVADRRPELAPDVVKALGSQGSDQAAQEALRRFCSHKDAAVRSSAMTALGTNATAEDLRPALADSAVRMRIAAATIVEELLEQERPDGSRQRNEQTGGTDWEEWLRNFRSGKGRPGWTTEMIEPLRKMLQSKEPSEQLAAAIPLVALGDDKDAVDFLRQSLNTQHAQARNIASALKWLPWDARFELFGALRSAAGSDPQVLGILATGIASVPSDKITGTLWELLNDKAANISVASQVQQSLIRAYTGMEYWNFRQESVQEPHRKALIDACKSMAAQGGANQRLVALAILLSGSPEDASASASALLEGGGGGDGLRTAALQVLLLSQTRADGVKSALAYLSAPPLLRKVALAYLAAGGEPIRIVEGEMYLNYSNPQLEFRIFSEGSAVTIEPPAGVTAPMLDPLLKDPELENVAYASYLLCLLGQQQGTDTVVHWWQGHRDDETWRRLAYRAIALTGDDGRTPVLEEIYATYDKRNGYEVRDFYWTIRVMKGPQVLKLRKRIRDEIGMAQLR
jgi:HEAT repeat protein/thioredoxin-like negative regulator of GroEL